MYIESIQKETPNYSLKSCKKDNNSSTTSLKNQSRKPLRQRKYKEIPDISHISFLIVKTSIILFLTINTTSNTKESSSMVLPAENN